MWLGGGSSIRGRLYLLMGSKGNDRWVLGVKVRDRSCLHLVCMEVMWKTWMNETWYLIEI
jgi:hypothetical protein